MKRFLSKNLAVPLVAYAAVIAVIIVSRTAIDREYALLHGDNIAPIGDVAVNFSRLDSDKVNEGLDGSRRTGDLAHR